MPNEALLTQKVSRFVAREVERALLIADLRDAADR
jgi:hypothetical protein